MAPFPLQSILWSTIYYQTLRAMNHSKIADYNVRLMHSQLEKDLPAERLPVPGPHLPMLKALCASSPDDPHYRMISPFVPSHPGPRNAGETIRTILTIF